MKRQRMQSGKFRLRNAADKKRNALIEVIGAEKTTLSLNPIKTMVEAMVRLLPTVLVICALLICPYRCLGSATQSASSDDAELTCSCCAKTEAHCESADELGSIAAPVPVAPDEHCGCGSCVCHGAVRGDDVMPSSLMVAISGLDVPPQGMALPSVCQWHSSADESPPGPYFLSGRLLRLNISSLQV